MKKELNSKHLKGVEEALETTRYKLCLFTNINSEKRLERKIVR
jgi:hypothetical protein